MGRKLVHTPAYELKDLVDACRAFGRDPAVTIVSQPTTRTIVAMGYGCVVEMTHEEFQAGLVRAERGDGTWWFWCPRCHHVARLADTRNMPFTAHLHEDVSGRPWDGTVACGTLFVVRLEGDVCGALEAAYVIGGEEAAQVVARELTASGAVRSRR